MTAHALWNMATFPFSRPNEGFSLSIKENQVLSSSIVWSLEKLEFLSALSGSLAGASVASGAGRGEQAQGIGRGSTIRGG